MSVLNSDHLLDQADRLLAPPGGGAPRQADLRRAISSAYYAVFHAVATQAADDLVGSRHRATPQYALAYRSIDHGSLRRFCDDVTKPQMPAKYSKYLPRGGFGPNLPVFAAAVVGLQEKRHLADYDSLFRVRTSDAELAVATGRTAIAEFRNAGRTPRKAFLLLVVLSPRS
jgi:hypothetical protein